MQRMTHSGKFPAAKMNEFLNEKDQTKLKSLLSYHILPGSWTSANLGTTPVRKSVTGQTIAFSDSNGLKVNDSLVQPRNIEATDGVIHQIDTDLTQPPFGAALAASANRSVAPSTVPTPVPEGMPAAAETVPDKSVL